jgi:hypothetical protein
MNKLDNEAAIMEEQIKQKEKADALHLNRVKFNRWVQKMDRGYNFVKNEVVTNLLKPLPRDLKLCGIDYPLLTTTPDHLEIIHKVNYGSVS